MTKQKTIFCLVIFLLGTVGLVYASADSDMRQKVIKFFRKMGLNEKLNAGVNVSMDKAGLVCITDEGSFFMQYVVKKPNISADANNSVNAVMLIEFIVFIISGIKGLLIIYSIVSKT